MSVSTDLRVDTSQRRALLAFVIWLALCAPILMWIGRGNMPTTDDWQLTAARLNDRNGLLGDHNGHLSVIPVLIYKTLFGTIGFTSYVPYRVLSVAIHLLVAVLLRVLMRSSGVSPWPATIVAGLFALINGGPLVLTQFQMTLALCFGLAMVLAADRGSGLPALLAWGLAGIMTSAIAVPVVAAAGVIAWRRQGLRFAALATVPLAAVFTAWLLWNETQNTPDPPLVPSLLPEWLRLSAFGLARTTAQNVLLAVALIAGVGFGLYLVRTKYQEVRLFVPVVLAGSSVLLILVTFVGRGFWVEAATQSRFMYLDYALLAPLVAAGLDGLVRRNRWLGLVVVLPLAVGTLFGLRDLDREGRRLESRTQLQMDQVTALFTSPAAQDTPDWVQPYRPGGFDGVGRTTWGQIQQARADGRLPPPRDGADTQAATVRLRLIHMHEPASGRCVLRQGSHSVELSAGERIGIKGTTTLDVRLPGQASSVSFSPNILEGSDFLLVGRDPVTGGNMQFEFSSPGDFYICS